MRNSLLLGAALGLLAITSQSNATLMVCQHPACELQGTGIENILLTDNQVGNPVTGVTNQTSTLVDFTSTTDTLLTQGSGQSEIRALDGIINEISFYAQDPGIGFSHVVFNVDAAADSLIQITAVDNFGTLFDFGSFTADGSGQNFFTIGSDDVQWARIVNIYGDGINVLTELQQIRVDPDLIPDPVSVTAPGHVALLAMGLCGLVMARARK